MSTRRQCRAGQARGKGWTPKAVFAAKEAELGGQTKSCPTVANGKVCGGLSLIQSPLTRPVRGACDVIKQLSPHSLLDFFVAFFGGREIGQDIVLCRRNLL